METWNNLVDKFDLLLERIKFGSTVKIAGREIPPVVMGFALVIICIPIWAYLEIEGDNKLIGALVVILMAWGVAQLGALGLGDGIGEKPGMGSSSTDWSFAAGTMSKSSENSDSIERPVDASETQPDQLQRLALLAFAGVIAVLVVLYLVRNFDSYEELNIEFRYSELVDMVEPVQDTIEAALLSGRGVDMDLLDSGEAGLPDEMLVSEEAHGISVIDGQIIATWMKDESDLDGVTYILTPKVEDGEVEWATTGTCGSKNAC
ncbi:MAG: hypothetical protein O2948_06425 [Proteobacteria bacterium]|nr:hypothetical protein [Pseudomonadota bacterium]MDA0926481.1 hypothetical protein [Pseudomonadota bacterium]